MVSSWLSLLWRGRKRRRRLRSDNTKRSMLVKLLLVLVFAGGTILLVFSSRKTVVLSPTPPVHATWHTLLNTTIGADNKRVTSNISGKFTVPPQDAVVSTPMKKQPSTSNTTPSINDHYISQKKIEKSTSDGPYHNRQLFESTYRDMLQNMKIYVYPIDNSSYYTSSFPRIFQPLSNPANPSLKLGNYFSEHAFKTSLFQSPFLTLNPKQAHFFFMPFSINAMRNEQRLHSAKSIVDFVANYTNEIATKFPFWNASGGSDHLYVCCHSIGREAASKHHNLHNNAIQVTCSSSYFQRLYVTHKDVALAQVWPRPRHPVLNPPHARNRLAFFIGRKQNSRIRQKLISSLGSDISMDILSGNLTFPYEEGFQRSKFCLHVKGYEVNTARISDAIHYGCIPVIISNYYDLPYANVLDWSKFSIIISEGDIESLKDILLSVSTDTYLSMYRNLRLVRRHFAWHMPPQSYDSFFMTAYQLWLRRGLHRLQN